MYLRTLFYLAISLFITQCTTGDKSQSDSKPIQRKGDQAKQITFSGQNKYGRFSPDAQKIIFHSSNRKNHENSQIYIMDIGSKKERRITYHDGDTANAQFLYDSKNIAYLSTTDEIKEYPRLIQEVLEGKSIRTKSENELYLHPLRPYEVYTSRIDGSTIKRLTRTRGYDGSLFWNSNDRLFYFTSQRNKRLQLYSMSMSGRALRRKLPRRNNVFDVRYNKSQKTWAWIEYSPDFQSSNIFVSRANFSNVKQLKLPQGLHWSLEFFPDGQRLIFSSQSPGTTGFNLFAYNLKTDCIDTITELTGHEYAPDFNPVTGDLLFTYKTSLETQLYIHKINSKELCGASPPPAQIQSKKM